MPIGYMNTSTALWGADAREFRPERWLDADGIPRGAQAIQGHRHLLTFVDGQRMCLGRGFALAEFKVRRRPSSLRFLARALRMRVCAGGPWRAHQELHVRAPGRAGDGDRVLSRGAAPPAARRREGRECADAGAPR